MKKKISVILCAVALFSFGFAACTNQSGADSSRSTTTTVTASSEETTTTTEQTTSTTITATTTTSAAPSPNTDQDKIAELAKSLVGSPFKFGKAGPDEFDNSGFLVYCFGQNGVKLPRKTGEIVKQGTEVDKIDLQPGDIVFFYNETPGVAVYAGIYIGDNQFVASEKQDIPVSIHKMNLPYFKDHFVCAKRYIN